MRGGAPGGPPSFPERFTFRPLAVISHRRGNHLTSTLSPHRIDSLAGLIAIKTGT